MSKLSSHAARSALRALLAALFVVTGGAVVTGCDGCAKKEADPRAQSSDVVAPAIGPDAGTASAQPQPSSMRELHPVIRTIADEGVLPSRIVVELSRPVMRQWPKAAPLGTVLRIEPPVDGALQFTTASTLVFTPSEPFAHGTHYKVTLESVALTADVLLPREASDVFEHQFDTPAFDFVRLTLHEVSVKKKRLEVDVVFSGPVDASAVKRAAHWKLSGATMGDIACSKTEDANVARCIIAHNLVNEGAFIELSLDAGLASTRRDGGRITSARTGRLDVPSGKEMKVLGGGLTEGGNGFFFSIICTDDASGKPERYAWDEALQQSHQVSRRCQLDESEALEAVHVTPKTALSVAASDHGFRVFGAFERGTYTLRIDAGVHTVAVQLNVRALPPVVRAETPDARFLSP